MIRTRNDKHYHAPAGGIRLGGRFYQENQRIPARYGRALESGAKSVDPSIDNPLTPPGHSREVIPHITSFQGLISTVSHVYRNPDEAIKHSLENARYMRNDCSIMECLEARQRMTALLNWHIEAEDSEDPRQAALVDAMTSIMKKIPRFTEYRRNLLEALWYGRHAVQHRYGFVHPPGGGREIVIAGWTPINGDKLVFRFDDGSAKFDPNEVGIKMSTVWPQKDAVLGNRKREITEYGPAYFLEPWERTRLAIHRHIIEDGSYEDPVSAGRVHGVGIRDRIYWCWFQKQETMAHLMEIVERTGNGFTIYYYPAGNNKAKAEIENVAREQTHTNVLVMPRMPGDPAMDAYGLDRIEPSTAGVDALRQIVSEFFGHQIKRYILGQTLSSEQDGGGFGDGVASLHLETLLQIIQYDAVGLEETLTVETLNPLKNYNFPWARDIQLRFVIDTESADSEKKMGAYRQAWEMGAKLKAADVMDIIGASVPTEDDEALQNPTMMQQARLWEQSHPGVPQPPGGGGMDEDDPGLPPDDGGPPDEGDGGSPADDGGDDLEAMFGPLLEAAQQAGGAQQYARKAVKSSPGQKEMFPWTAPSTGSRAKWREELHPRDEGGQFSEKEGEKASGDDDRPLLADVGTDEFHGALKQAIAEHEPEAGEADSDPSDGDGDSGTQQPWQMTLSEYQDQQLAMTKSGIIDPAKLARLDEDSHREMYAEWHADEVATAIDNGESVPDSVLADYPELSSTDEKPAAPAADSESQGEATTEDNPPAADGEPAAPKQGDDVTRLTNEEFASGDWDHAHAGLYSEWVAAKIADGMKGIEGREYAIRQHDETQWQLVSRPGTPPIEAEPDPPAKAAQEVAKGDATPREEATLSTDRAMDSNYAWARPSEVPNVGEDLTNSARHRANAWRTLEDAEADGRGDEFAKRSFLEKQQPHDYAGILDDNPTHSVSAMAAHLALKGFPAKAGYGKQKARENDRPQYVAAYSRLQEKAGALAREHANPMEVLSGLQSEVRDMIGELRGSKDGPLNTTDENGKKKPDSYNNIANSLVGLQKKLSTRFSRTNTVAKQLNDFLEKHDEKYGAETEDRFATISKHAAAVLDGKSIDKAFGISPAKGGGAARKRFNPVEAYVAHARREGGREDGKNAAEAAEHMVGKMGVRGIQYGNSMTDDERTHHSMKCTEAFMDLMDVLGLEDSDVGLGGKLGMALGARGHGWASAHYEPQSKNINLTRTRGVGSLAHEWGHFFDNEIAGGQVGSYASEAFRWRVVMRRKLENGEVKLGNTPNAKASFDKRYPPFNDDGERDLAYAVHDAMESMDSSGFSKRLGQVLGQYVREGRMSRQKASDYWSAGHEKFARTFEQYVQRKLQSGGRENSYLAGLADHKDDETRLKLGTAVWPTPEEIDHMTPAFDAIFAAYAKVKAK